MIKNVRFKILISICFFAFFSKNTLIAQNYIIIDGYVTNISGQPLSKAHVQNITKKLGTITDNSGEFKIIASPNDSMFVSSIGFKTYKVRVPNNLPYKVLNIKIILITDTIMLKEFTVRDYPPTYELFKKAFVPLKLKEIPNKMLFTKIVDKQYNPKGGIVMPGPISLIYEAFSKDAKNRRKLAALVYQDNLREIVYDKVPKQVLINAYHFKDESELEQFLEFCQIPEELILNGSAYQLIVYMNISYYRYPKLENQ